MGFVYILKSKKDASYYIGATKNYRNRIKEHNFGGTGYSFKKRPWKLVYLKKFQTFGEAVKEERRLKMCKNKKYIEWLIKNGPVAQR